MKELNLSPESYLLDTIILVRYLRGDQHLQRQVDTLPQIFISPTVISELTLGAQRSSDPIKGMQEIDELVKRFVPIEIDTEVGFLAGKIKAYLMAQGNMIPENDIWIAATVVAYQCTLVTRDLHFTHIPSLVHEQW